MEYTRTTSGTIFQRGCMDKWWSSDFSIETWYIPLEAFASKNYSVYINAMSET